MSKKSIHQFLPSLAYGDAVGNYTLLIQKLLKKNGFDSKIYCYNNDQKSEQLANHFSTYKGNSKNTIIYHSAIGSPILDYIKKLPDKKILIYHNITPSEFFKDFNQTAYQITSTSRSQLKNHAKFFTKSIGVSEFNTSELIELGFKNVTTIPLLIDFKKYISKTNQTLFTKIKSSSKTNIIFIGRFAPNKKHDDIIKAFFIYNKYFNPDSKLHLIGSHSPNDLYFKVLQKLIKILNLEHKVIFQSHLSNSDLHTYYKAADLFLAMSEHEGFFVPIVECFYFNLPVIAYDAGAVKETLKDGGILVKHKDYYKIAETIHQTLSNKSKIEEIKRNQKTALTYYQSETHTKNLLNTLLLD